MGLGRVLVVDDDECVRQTLRLILKRAGYDVVEAEDGEKGVAAIQKSDGDALLVDLIICDLCMPKMNGMEAITYFHSQFPSVPVIVLTGTPDLINAKKLKMEQGVTGYLVKPIRPTELVAAVRKASLHKALKGHVFFNT
jgi:two-component system, chemotaxis family, chemotaxis protein CheY